MTQSNGLDYFIGEISSVMALEEVTVELKGHSEPLHIPRMTIVHILREGVMQCVTGESLTTGDKILLITDHVLVSNTCRLF